MHVVFRSKERAPGHEECPLFLNTFIFYFIFVGAGPSLLHAGFLWLQQAEATLSLQSTGPRLTGSVVVAQRT